MSDSYAIVETGGKQYRAEKGAELLVERLPDDEGAKLNLRAVAYRGDKVVVVAAKDLEKVKVEAVVTEHLKGDKIRVFKYRAKKRYRRRSGHRSLLTRLEISDIKLGAAKPKAAAAKPAAAKKKADEGAQPKKTPARKPASRKTTRES
jgi:large subunit ribosomal protein L21